jgi:hypothetical protein
MILRYGQNYFDSEQIFVKKLRSEGGLIGRHPQGPAARSRILSIRLISCNKFRLQTIEMNIVGAIRLGCIVEGLLSVKNDGVLYRANDERSGHVA